MTLNSEAMCDLTICKLSDCSSLVSGGKEIILLCDKIVKGKVRSKYTQSSYVHPPLHNFKYFHITR